MVSKEALEELYKEREYLLGEKVNNKTKNWHNDITHYDNINHCLLTIKQDLDRLEKLEKAFDKACERLDWDCPEEQNLIDDFIDYFDCENCKNTEKECWKKYFLKEALE